MDVLCFFCLLCARLFVCALWSPIKGLVKSAYASTGGEDNFSFSVSNAFC